MGHHHHKINRRTFLGQASCGAVGLTTMFSTMLNFKAMNAAANLCMNSFPPVLDPFDDYKAIVCILLAGGCDTYNMLVPTGTSDYNEYAAARSNQALPKGSLININPLNGNGKEFGLHPSMVNMASLFENENLAFVANVGSLVEPTTKTGVYNGSNKLPLGLYSHSDQVAHWQTAIPQDRVGTGWAGRMADLLNTLPNGPEINPNISMNISLSGSNILQTGNTSVEYAITRNGATGLHGYNDESVESQLRREVVDNMIDASYQDIFKKTYMKTIKTGRDGNAQIIEALKNATPLVTQFNPCINAEEYNCLSRALGMIANTINVRQSLGVKRQIFFVEYGGWDHHDELLMNQANMMQEVDTAMGTFYQALQEMGVENQVTTFSLSEFARTLTSNGNGTDHGWGGNMFVMGGDVNGRKIYGDYPQLALGSNHEVGNGVLIPTLSADEYFAEMALWYDVPTSNLVDIFPNIRNFYASNSTENPIGFMKMG